MDFLEVRAFFYDNYVIDDRDWMKLTSLVNRTDNNRIDDLEENR